MALLLETEIKLYSLVKEFPGRATYWYLRRLGLSHGQGYRVLERLEKLEGLQLIRREDYTVNGFLRERRWWPILPTDP